MNIWIVMIGLGLLTFATRLSFITLLARLRLPPAFQRALRFVPIAALTAIIAPELARYNDALNLTPGNPRLLAGLAAILVAIYTKNTLWTILAGMVIFILLRQLP